MLPMQTIEELISVSYVSAIIARSGFSPNTIAKDYGVDLEVRNIGIDGNKRIDLGSVLELQLKASVNWTLEELHVVYDLDADAYNRMIFRNENSFIPCYLVLCCLPKDEEDWIDVGEEELKIRRCCYYCLLEGPKSTNSSTKRLRIPRTHLLTPGSLIQLKEQVFEGLL